MQDLADEDDEDFEEDDEEEDEDEDDDEDQRGPIHRVGIEIGTITRILGEQSI